MEMQAVPDAFVYEDIDDIKKVLLQKMSSCNKTLPMDKYQDDGNKHAHQLTCNLIDAKLLSLIIVVNIIANINNFIALSLIFHLTYHFIK